MTRKSLFLFLIAVLTTGTLRAQDIQLQDRDRSAPMTLIQALTQRHSVRNFSSKPISDNQLYTILWSGCGFNRRDQGRITAPSAINAQDIEILVFRADGVYHYLPEEKILQKQTSKDLRKAVAGRQDFVAKAPVVLVLMSNHKKFGKLSHAAERMGLIDAGYVSENICLACTAIGLATVPRMSMDTETLKKELHLGDEYDLIVNHPIGYAETGH